MSRIDNDYHAADAAAKAAEELLKMMEPHVMSRLKDAYALGWIAGVRAARKEAAGIRDGGSNES